MPQPTRLEDEKQHRWDDDEDPCSDVDGSVAGVLETPTEEEPRISREMNVILDSSSSLPAGPVLLAQSASGGVDTR